MVGFLGEVSTGKIEGLSETVEEALKFFSKNFDGGLIEEGEARGGEAGVRKLGVVSGKGFKKYAGGAGFGETENTGGNGGEGKRGEFQFFGALEGTVDRGFEFPIFVTAPPNRANRVDDVPGGEVAPGSIRGPVMRNRAVLVDPGAAFFLNDASSASGNDGCDPATMHEPFVRRVDNGVYSLLGDVTLYEFELLTGGEMVSLKKLIHRKYYTV